MCLKLPWNDRNHHFWFECVVDHEQRLQLELGILEGGGNLTVRDICIRNILQKDTNYYYDAKSVKIKLYLTNTVTLKDLHVSVSKIVNQMRAFQMSLWLGQIVKALDQILDGLDVNEVEEEGKLNFKKNLPP